MVELDHLDFNDVLESKKYGIEWKVTGIISDADTGERIGVSVTEAKSGSVRMDTFDQDDLTNFKKAS